MNKNYHILESQIREIYGRVVYTHKTHEKCADILKCRNDVIKYVEIILSISTTTSILVTIFGESFLYQILAAIFSTSLLGITLYTKDFDLLGLVEKHKQASLDILEVRENLLSLLIDIRIGNKSLNELQKRRDDINIQLINIYKTAPKTFDKAFRKASIALQYKEEFTFSDNEIDKFLPENLRKTK